MGCARRKAPAAGVLDLTIDELKAGETNKDKITNVADMFVKGSKAEAQTNPELPAGGLRTGLTVTILKCKLAFTEEDLKKLPPYHRNGLFKEAKTYDGFVRINVTEFGATRVSIRIDVPESMEVLEWCETEKNQAGYRGIDFLLAEGFHQFFVPNVKTLEHVMSVADNPSLKTLFKGPVGNLVRAIKGVNRAKADIDQTQGVFGKSYYSGLPFGAGPRAVVKIGVRATEKHDLKDVVGGKKGADLTGKEDEVTKVLVEDMIEKMKGAAKSKKQWDFDFVAQVGMRSQTHSIAEGDIFWDEKISEYLKLGTFTILPEAADKVGGLTGQQELLFNPWNQLKAHRPVVELNLTRWEVYQKHGELRKQLGTGVQVDRVCPFLDVVGA
jgi:hypothetical protein